MPESPSSSFIPKRNPSKKSAAVRTTNLVVLSLFSYALFVAAPLAAAAVFIYERHTVNQFNKAVAGLDEAIKSFNEEDLDRVTEFSERVAKSKELLGSHVSVVTMLKAIESATSESVTFKNLTITRTSPQAVSVKALLNTTAFDGALFQRKIYAANNVIKNITFKDTKIILPAATESTVSSNDSNTIEFNATFDFVSTDVLYKPLGSEAGGVESPSLSTPSANVNDADEGSASSTRQTNI